jgi:hypothetical protein
MTGSMIAGAALLVSACGGGNEANNTAGANALDTGVFPTDGMNGMDSMNGMNGMDSMNGAAGTDMNGSTGMGNTSGSTGTDMNGSGNMTGGNTMSNGM